ncbi:HAD family hydrolase [Microbacterium sp. A93]|uniref:HAD family hydrolase n=1 Tax=Microbacterium sp. A93 TaxID=3450716 RepID=UPI003F437A33
MSVLPRLIASDLDGTLLGADSTVSPRTRAALDAARAAGIHVVPVTARQPIGIRAIADGAGFEEWALCGNGAFAIHLTTGELLFERAVTVDAQQALAAALAERVPGLLHVSVRDAGEGFFPQQGYAAIAEASDHKRDPAGMTEVPLSEVLSAPSLKLVIRHPKLPPTEILAAIAGLGLGGFEATVSGAPFVEVMAAGVTKAWGLEQLCAHLGIAAGEVLAFGDAPNDVEMLRWAGHGVAMSNADAVVKDSADEISLASNTEDGVALMLERVLGAHV